MSADLTPQPRPRMDRHDPECLDPQPQAWRLAAAEPQTELEGERWLTPSTS